MLSMYANVVGGPSPSSEPDAIDAGVLDENNPLKPPEEESNTTSSNDNGNGHSNIFNPTATTNNNNTGTSSGSSNNNNNNNETMCQSEEVKVNSTEGLFKNTTNATEILSNATIGGDNEGDAIVVDINANEEDFTINTSSGTPGSSNEQEQCRVRIQLPPLVKTQQKVPVAHCQGIRRWLWHFSLLCLHVSYCS